MFDIVIIGTGIVGAMTARTLSSYNLKVCVVEKNSDVSMGATMANSGIVHAGFDAKEGSLKALLNVKGCEMMPKIAKELNVKYRNNGSLVVGYNDEDKAELENLLERGIKNGVKGLKLLNAKEVRELEKNISDDVICALYAPTGGIICPYSLAIAAMGNAMDNGVELKLDFDVLEISYNGEYYTVKSNGEEVCAKYVINAAGIYSDKIAQMVGDNSFSVNPRKGEYILLDKECGNLANCTLFKTPTKMGKGILVSPTAHGNLLLGPTSVDIDDKEDKSTAPEGFDSIIEQAKTRIKNIPFGKTITSFCGLRSVGSTGDFIINSNKPNFINAAGIESPGLTASPAIAEYIVNMLKEMGLNLVKNENYNPNRKPIGHFSELSIEEKNKIIKENSAYGKIICRCEGITKGEILEAIHTNPKATTVDGIKRRTRASMGRCQGGFCYPYIIEILSEELGIPYDQVTKFGGNSKINLGKTKEGVSYENC